MGIMVIATRPILLAPVQARTVSYVAAIGMKAPGITGQRTRHKNSPVERHLSIGFRLLRLDVPKPLEMVSIPPGTFMMGSPE